MSSDSLCRKELESSSAQLRVWRQRTEYKRLAMGVSPLWITASFRQSNLCLRVVALTRVPRQTVQPWHDSPAPSSAATDHEEESYTALKTPVCDQSD